MTDWVSIANSAVAPKAPLTSELVTALRDNTVVSTWEFYETVYDFALDGAVSVITTSNFEDGWEYGFRIVDWSHNHTSNARPAIGFYDEINNEWDDVDAGFDLSNTGVWGNNQFMPLNLPRVPAATFQSPTQSATSPGPNQSISWAPQVIFSSGSYNNRVLRNVRFFWTDVSSPPHPPVGQTDSGVIKMYRRKENVSDA